MRLQDLRGCNKLTHLKNNLYRHCIDNDNANEFDSVNKETSLGMRTSLVNNKQYAYVNAHLAIKKMYKIDIIISTKDSSAKSFKIHIRCLTPIQHISAP